MKSSNTIRKKLSKVSKQILILLSVSGIILFDFNFSFEKLKEIHIEKEKKLGNEKVNKQLYCYFDKNHIQKKIVTDYQYLWILPQLSNLFEDGRIQSLQPSDPVFSEESVGYLLMTPLFDSSNILPGFIEEKIKSGEYIEIFNFDGYRFIKIR